VMFNVRKIHRKGRRRTTNTFSTLNNCYIFSHEKFGKASLTQVFNNIIYIRDGEKYILRIVVIQCNRYDEISW